MDTSGLSYLLGWFQAGGAIVDLKIFMMLFFLHGTAIGIFSLYVFDMEWTVKYRRFILAYSISGTAFFGIFPWNTPNAGIIVTSIMMPAILLVLYRAAISNRLKEDRLMWLFFIALVLHTITGVVQNYYFNHLLFMTGLIVDMFLLMSQAVILSKQFAEMKETELALKEKNAILDRLDLLKTEFFQNTSHDFKTPLTVISTSVSNVTDMLDYEIDKKAMRESLSSAQREIMRMARMVDGAINHSSFHDNRQDNKPIDIAPLLKEGAQSYSTLLERHGNSLSLEIPESLPVILGNADMLLHVFANLLSNADRHTKNGVITIEAMAKSNAIWVIVRDNGEGVRPEILPNIFERGASDGGTGLGLSICRSAVEAHGGTISIKSEYEQGTEVTLILPIYQRNDGTSSDAVASCL